MNQSITLPPQMDTVVYPPVTTAPFHLPGDQKAAAMLPAWVWVIASAMMILGAFSSNPLLTPGAILVLTACNQLLWRRGEPPVLAFACSMQWLQAAAIIFYTNFHGVSVAQAGGELAFERATWVSLGAVLVLALGMRLGLTGARHSQHAPLVAEATQVNVGNAFVAYLITFGVALFATAVAFRIPGLTQVIWALITLKWSAVFLLAYCVIEQRQGYIFLLAVVILEVALGFVGYFSGFKSVFFVLLVVALASPFALQGRRVVLTISLAFALFFFGVVWSAIKVEYRQFLNQGSDQQVVVVTLEESVGKLGDLISGFTLNNFTEGLDAMILRVGYVNFFALTLMNVPDGIPYEHGTLWFGALKHIVTPRLFFPEKAAISDSDRTSLYTGIRVAGGEEGTSIGIGYVGESYVDFGPVWMFAPIFLLGVFYGLIYRVFVVHSRSKLICTAIGSAILIFGAYTIETSNIKIVGGNVTVLLVMAIIYLCFGRFLRSWLEQRPR